MLETYKKRLESIGKNRKDVWAKLNGARRRKSELEKAPQKIDAILTHVFGVIEEPKPQCEIASKLVPHKKQEDAIIRATVYIEESKDLDPIIDTLVTGDGLKGGEKAKITALLNNVKNKSVRKDICWTAIAFCIESNSKSSIKNKRSLLTDLEDYYKELINNPEVDATEINVLNDQMGTFYYDLYLNESQKDYYIAAYEYWGTPKEATDAAFEEENLLVKADCQTDIDVKIAALLKTDPSVVNKKIRQCRRSLLKCVLEEAGKRTTNGRDLLNEKEKLFAVANSIDWDLTTDFQDYQVEYRNTVNAMESDERRIREAKQKSMLTEYFGKGHFKAVISQKYSVGKRFSFSADSFEQALERCVSGKVNEVLHARGKIVTEAEIAEWVKKFYAYIMTGENSDNWNINRQALADEYFWVVYIGQITEYIEKNVGTAMRSEFYRCRTAPELKEWLKKRSRGERGYSDLTDEEVVFCATYIRKIIQGKKTSADERVAAPTGAKYYTEEMKAADVVIPWSLVIHQLLYVSGMFGVCKNIADANMGINGIGEVVLHTLPLFVIMSIISAIEGSKIRAKVKKQFSKVYFTTHSAVTLIMTVIFAAIMLGIGESLWLVIYKVILSVLLYLSARVVYLIL